MAADFFEKKAIEMLESDELEPIQFPQSFREGEPIPPFSLPEPESIQPVPPGKTLRDLLEGTPSGIPKEERLKFRPTDIPDVDDPARFFFETRRDTQEETKVAETTPIPKKNFERPIRNPITGEIISKKELKELRKQFKEGKAKVEVEPDLDNIPETNSKRETETVIKDGVKIKKFKDETLK